MKEQTYRGFLVAVGLGWGVPLTLALPVALLWNRWFATMSWALFWGISAVVWNIGCFLVGLSISDRAAHNTEAGR